MKDYGKSKKGFCSQKCEILGKIKKDINGCWIWQGSKWNTVPYGKISIGKKKCLSHRISYIVFKGAIPEGINVRHKCDVYECCNPEHLEIGTQHQNIQDAIDRRRINLKLTWENVLEIRNLHKNGLGIHPICKRYNVCYKTIKDIVNFVKRKNPPPATVYEKET